MVSLVAFVDRGWVIGGHRPRHLHRLPAVREPLSLYPLVYSRTVELSPLAILVAVLIGASLAGIIGALAAIPVAGSIQVLLQEWLEYRRERLDGRSRGRAATGARDDLAVGPVARVRTRPRIARPRRRDAASFNERSDLWT